MPEEGEIMKLIFNDGAELTIQKAYINSDGALCIKTISGKQEQLRAMFSDAVKTKKITIVEREKNIAVYENYTQFEGITVYNAGILEPFLFKAGETPDEKLKKLEEENKELKDTVNMLRECILEMSETVYQ